MPFHAYFDGPENYDQKYVFFKEGGSPHLLQKLIALFEKQKGNLLEINLCWYLFNNKILHQYLKNLSTEGIKVNVITIPLEGYDDTKPQYLQALGSGWKSEKAYTKYDLAREIACDVFHNDDFPNYNIFYFPHLYVRSKRVKKFSRGALPYSLHAKVGYLKTKNGGIALMGSSNLAVRDLVKNESLLVIENEPEYLQPFSQFFQHLLQHSITLKHYRHDLGKYHRYPSLSASNNQSTHFSAPFYGGSSIRMENRLAELLRTAKHRIIICAQHLAAFDYKYHPDGKRNKGVLGIAIEMAKQGVEVTCLSQTFSSKENMGNFRKPTNSNNFDAFFSAYSQLAKAKYFVNENWHSKFIIVDETLIFCTYNFTPTQFIYLKDVKIKQFVEMPELSYRGTHCEVAGHVVVYDASTVEAFEHHFFTVLKNDKTVRIL